MAGKANGRLADQKRSVGRLVGQAGDGRTIGRAGGRLIGGFWHRVGLSANWPVGQPRGRSDAGSDM